MAEVWAAVGRPASQFRRRGSCDDLAHVRAEHWLAAAGALVDKDGRVTPETSALVAAVDVLSDRALEVRALYSEFERREYGHEWSVSELMAGFVVDVGDLTRLVMASQGSRRADDVEQRLAHELADCLWSVLVLARRLDVNLGASFSDTMDVLEARQADHGSDGV